MRFYPKYDYPDEITRIFVPEDVFRKTQTEIHKEMRRENRILYANKFGPKNFQELISEIKKELKSDQKKVNCYT